MQTGIDVVVISVVVIFVTIGLTKLFTDFWDKLFDRVKQWRNPDIKIEIRRAVHKFNRGLFLHNMDIVFYNTTEIQTRIENVKIFDKKKRELEFVRHGQAGPVTSFDIPGYDIVPWFIFCNRQQTGETTHAKLKVCIYPVGKRKICKKFESTIIEAGQFPTGDFFVAF